MERGDSIMSREAKEREMDGLRERAALFDRTCVCDEIRTKRGNAEAGRGGKLVTDGALDCVELDRRNGGTISSVSGGSSTVRGIPLGQIPPCTLNVTGDDGRSTH